MAAGALVGVGLGVLSVVGLFLAANNASGATTKPTPTPSPTGTMTCEQALTTLESAGAKPEITNQIRTLFNGPKDSVTAKSALQLATMLELAASTDAPASMQLPLKTVAKCLRDWAASAGMGGDGKGATDMDLLTCDQAVAMLPAEIRSQAQTYLAMKGQPMDAATIATIDNLASTLDGWGSLPGAGSLTQPMHVTAQCLRLVTADAKKTTPTPAPTGGGTATPGELVLDKGNPLKDKNGVPSNPTGGPAQTGVASNPAFQWLYVVKAGDSPFTIAAKFFGSAANYTRVVELVQNNPTEYYSGRKLGSVGDPLNPATSKYNFASLQAGDVLKVPKAWNRWIDQWGTMRKDPMPYPDS